MNPPPSDRRLLVGRFILETGGERWTGLTAAETVRFLDENPGENVVIYRIHRVTEEGRMELVCVTPRAFRAEEAILFRRRTADLARRDFTALHDAASAVPPPCPIHMQLAESGDGPRGYVLVIAFPAPCLETVGHWLQQCRLRPGDEVEAGRNAWQEFQAASPQIVEEAWLSPAS